MSRPTSRTTGQIAGATITGAILGLGGGAAIAAGLPSRPIWSGAAIGAITMAAVSGWADASRVPGRPQPVWVRILASGMLAAVIGWVIDLTLPDWSSAGFGAVVGATAGAIGGRSRKLLLGALTGALVGIAAEATTSDLGWSVVSATTVIVYRVAASVLYRGRERIRLLEERVSPRDVGYVVPLAERQGYVGIDYLQRHADTVGGSFERGPADIGIVDEFDELAGPDFDPALAHHLVREFYEHTSRFHLSITPHWRPWMRVPYLIYRSTLARPIGQANAPFNLEEAADGVVSWIDTLDLDDDGRPEFRAWVRAYSGTMEPMYVGIYTVVRHEGVGYVSVGFPLPSGSFTATLTPSNSRGDGLRLSSRDGAFGGHYLSIVDPRTDQWSVIGVGGFDEEIEVYVTNGELAADHRFSIAGLEFMSLNYSIGRGFTP